MSEIQTLEVVETLPPPDAGHEKAPEQTPEPVEAEPIAKEEVKAEEPAAVEEVAEEKKPEDNHDMRRMKRVLQEKFEAQAERDALRRQLEQGGQTQRSVSDEPAREQFNSDVEFFNAVRTYDIQKVRQEFEQKINSTKANDSFAVKAQEARKEIPDFDDVISMSSVRFVPMTQDVILASPVAAHLAYEIAKDDDLAVRLAAMSPHLAAREIGRLEARIEAEKERKAKPQAKPVSKAPAPIKPVQGKGDAIIDPSKMDDKTWVAWRRKQKYNLTN